MRNPDLTGFSLMMASLTYVAIFIISVLKFSEKSDSRMVDRLCCNLGNLAREGHARSRGRRVRRVSVIRGIKGRMLRGLFQETMKEKSHLFLSEISMLMHQLIWRLKKMPWQ